MSSYTDENLLSRVLLFFPFIPPVERLDQDKDTGGILTTICNHSFHCSCISKWTDSSCPGLSAGLLRRATYTFVKLGSLRVLTNKAVEANEGKPLTVFQNIAIGVKAGAIGAFVSCQLIWH
ncbi:putative mitochondrial 2-oxoglutarate/malate carrier protein [Carex littledalei]|uniref:Putative mitochondrial 2-oxoglutarate/malate carrier protein n=1 Tax=Carex littledalei TaxID=544730 RepID=A0A833RH16_9POAL|nr:putative mitochondrial 2-oxoglutarate/malate carrier protein [Carex littledalei]